MNIVQFQGGRYVPVREAGVLKPFAELSLAEQLSALRQEMPPADPAQFLVFTLEEEQIVFEAIGMLARNVGLDRGLGRIDWLDRRLLVWVAEMTGWQSLTIPTDGNAAAPVTQITSWSLAFRPLA